MKIGLIREGKNPPDKRVAFTPKQLKQIKETYPGKFDFKIQPSPFRCYTDSEYESEGIEVAEDITDCSLLFGIKEVPIDALLPKKTYVFFSHTIKEQVHNRALLRTILEKEITLIDYEVIKNDQGERLVAFGRWAGIVGAYNGLWTYGQKSGLYDLKRAFQCYDKAELDEELKKVQLPPIKIIVTGKGRVAQGVKEVLELVGIIAVDPHDFIHNYFDEPVYSILASEDYVRRKTDGGFDKGEFYGNPEKYESHFEKYAEVSDILIAAAYWDNRAPKLFELQDVKLDDFNLSVIADITCDIHGSIPTTVKSSTILNPVYDFDRENLVDLPPFGKQTSLSIMAIDNLPTELPRDASEDFGNQLIEHFIPELLKEESPVIDRATVTKEGDLTIEFIYLSDFINEAQNDQ